MISKTSLDLFINFCVTPWLWIGKTSQKAIESAKITDQDFVTHVPWSLQGISFFFFFFFSQELLNIAAQVCVLHTPLSLLSVYLKSNASESNYGHLQVHFFF